MFVYKQSYKNRYLLFQHATKLQKTSASLCKLYSGSTTSNFSANSLRVYHPSINAVIPTSHLFICNRNIRHLFGLHERSGFEPVPADAAGRVESQPRFRVRAPGLLRCRPSFQGFTFLPSKSEICIATLSSAGQHVSFTQIQRKSHNK